MTSSCIEGITLLSDPDAAQILLESLLFLQEERGVTLYAYVLMLNHFHIVAQGESLSSKMKNLKSFTATEIIKLLKKKKKAHLLDQLSEAKLEYKIESEHQVWQEGFHPKQIIGDEMMIQKIEYIHNNPLKREYVDEPVDWRYSSARNYAQLPGLIPVTLFSR